MKTRAGFLIALIAALLVSLPSFAQPPEAIDLLPPLDNEPLAVFSVDVKAVGEVGGLDTLAKAYPLLLRQLQRPALIRSLGFDLLTDLHSLAGAVWTDEHGDPGSFVLIASGSFKPQPIIAAIQNEAEFPVRNIAGYDVLVLGNEYPDSTVLFSVSEHAIVLMVGNNQLAEATLSRLAADREPNGHAARLEPFEGMFRLALNLKILPEEAWGEIKEALGIRPEDLLAVGISGSLAPVEALGMEIEVKTVFDTPAKAREAHLLAFGGIETAKQWAPLTQLFFDEITLQCEDNTLTATIEADNMMLAQVSMMAAILLPALNRAREAALRTSCINNVHRINRGIMLYVDGPGEGRFYPRSLEELSDKEIITDPRVFFCPTIDHLNPPKGHTDYDSIFAYAKIRLTRDHFDVPRMIVWCRAARPHGGSRIVGFSDGRVAVHHNLEHAYMFIELKEFLAGLEEE